MSNCVPVSLLDVMIRSILFPTDFSAVANSAFPLALAVAAQYDAIVQSIHIAHGGDPHITETSRYEFPAVPTGASSVRVIETIVPKDAEDPAQVIMRHAQERTCDLIVMALARTFRRGPILPGSQRRRTGGP